MKFRFCLLRASLVDGWSFEECSFFFEGKRDMKFKTAEEK